MTTNELGRNTIRRLYIEKSKYFFVVMNESKYKAQLFFSTRKKLPPLKSATLLTSCSYENKIVIYRITNC